MKKRLLIIAGLVLALALVGNVRAETLFVQAGATDQSVPITIVDSTTGLAETGVTSATAGLNIWYWRQGATVTNLTEGDLGSLDAAHDADAGEANIYEAANGAYRVDLPDAAFTAGAAWVKVGGTVTNMVVYGPTVMIAAPVGAAASVTGNVNGNVSGTVTLANGAHGGAAATLVLSDYSAFKATGFSTHTAANVVDEFETQSQADPTGFHVNVLEVGGTSQTANDNGADINSILLDTGTDGVLLAVDSIKKVTFDEATAWPLLSADTGSTQIARVGADSDTLETLSDQLDVVTTDTDELQTELADGGRTDLILDAILLDTGTTLPADLAPKGGNKLFP